MTYKGNTLYWSRGRMLERFGDKACYTYNSAGIRTEKCIKGVPTKYVVSGSTILSETTNGVTTVYYYSADGVVGFNRGGTDYFYRKNLQGDIIAIVNASGGVVAKYVYDAWGNHKVFNSAGTVIYDSQNPTSTYANEIGHINPFRYRSYYFDNETGLYYLQSRYYDPQVGRFINADSIDYLEPEQLQGLNLYSYCQNNPVMYYDPSGHIVVGLLISVLLSAMWGAVSAALSGQNVLAGAIVGGVMGLLSAGYIGFIGGSLSGITKTAFYAVSYFTFGAVENVAAQRFVEGKSVEQLNEIDAIFAGITNMAAGMGSDFLKKDIDKIMTNKYEIFLTKTSFDIISGFLNTAAGILLPCQRS